MLLTLQSSFLKVSSTLPEPRRSTAACRQIISVTDFGALVKVLGGQSVSLVDLVWVYMVSDVWILIGRVWSLLLLGGGLFDAELLDLSLDLVEIQSCFRLITEEIVRVERQGLRLLLRLRLDVRLVCLRVVVNVRLRDIWLVTCLGALLNWLGRQVGLGYTVRLGLIILLWRQLIGLLMNIGLGYVIGELRWNVTTIIHTMPHLIDHSPSLINTTIPLLVWRCPCTHFLHFSSQLLQPFSILQASHPFRSQYFHSHLPSTPFTINDLTIWSLGPCYVVFVDHSEAVLADSYVVDTAKDEIPFGDFLHPEKTAAYAAVDGLEEGFGDCPAHSSWRD